MRKKKCNHHRTGSGAGAYDGGACGDGACGVALSPKSLKSRTGPMGRPCGHGAGNEYACAYGSSCRVYGACDDENGARYGGYVPYGKCVSSSCWRPNCCHRNSMNRYRRDRLSGGELWSKTCRGHDGPRSDLHGAPCAETSRSAEPVAWNLVVAGLRSCKVALPRAVPLPTGADADGLPSLLGVPGERCAPQPLVAWLPARFV